MADSQLTDYIKKRVQEGAKRMEISVELVQSGWPPAQINEALSELQVPLDGAPEPTPAPFVPPTMPSAVPRGMSPVGQTVAQPAMPVQTQGDAPFMPEQRPPENAAQGALPGFLKILGDAWRAYRERATVFVGIALILVVLSYVAYGGVFLVMYALPFFGMYATVTLAIIGALLLFAAIIWSYIALYVAAIKRSGITSVRAGYRAASPIAGSYVWVQITAECVMLGALALFIGVPAAVIGGAVAFTGILHAPPSILLGIAALVIVSVGAFGVVSFYLSRLVFGTWLVVNTDARGIGALVQSAQLVKGRFWAVFWRLLGVLVVIVLLFVPAWLLAFGIGMLGTYASIFGGFLLSVYEYLFLMPFGLLAVTMLYEALPNTAPTVPPKRGWYIFLAWFGVVFGFLLPIIAGTVLASLNTARTRGNDVAIESNLMTIQTEAELYNYDHGNSYGTAATCEEGMFAADPVITQALHGIVQSGGIPQCTADGTHYVVHAVLSEGFVSGKVCVLTAPVFTVPRRIRGDSHAMAALLRQRHRALRTQHLCKPRVSSRRQPRRACTPIKQTAIR